MPGSTLEGSEVIHSDPCTLCTLSLYSSGSQLLSLRSLMSKVSGIWGYSPPDLPLATPLFVAAESDRNSYISILIPSVFCDSENQAASCCSSVPHQFSGMGGHAPLVSLGLRTPLPGRCSFQRSRSECC